MYHIMLQKQGHKKSSAKFSSCSQTYACRKWSVDEIREVHKRLFLFRNVALELFLNDGRNYLLTFWEPKLRDSVYNRLISKITSPASESIAGVQSQGSDSLGSKLSSAIFGSAGLTDLTQKWCQREISNFQYLMHLNTWAGMMTL